MEEKSYKSWTISDEFWNKVKDVIPDTAGKRDLERAYRNKPGQGCKALPARDVLEGVLYVLRTGSCSESVWLRKQSPPIFLEADASRIFPENLDNGTGKIRRTQRNRLGMAKRRRLYGKSAIGS